jgi:TonB family protein
MLGNKNYQQAIDYFQRTQNLDSKQAGPAQMWMALVREREQKPAEAETLFRSALAEGGAYSPDDATTMELYARFLKDQGRGDDAKSMLDRAADIRRIPVLVSNALRIGGGVTAPKVLSKVEPEYTEEARTAKYQGTVVLAVEIRPDGFADNIRVVRGLGLGLDENAMTAVRQWQFQPGTKDGAAVTVQATIEVNFRLL